MILRDLWFNVTHIGVLLGSSSLRTLKMQYDCRWNNKDREVDETADLK